MASPTGKPVRHGPYPEFTVPAMLVGFLLGAVICVSIAYASLILGFSIEGSELAAILGWGILRGVLKRTSIIENNINQTIASAVNGASSGMMFSVPALFILKNKYEGVTEFSNLLLILSCITGAVIGLSFVIPLRKQMIDFNRLAYPGGIAVASILKSPGAGITKAKFMLTGALISGGVHFFFKNIDLEHWHPPHEWGIPPFLNIGFYLSVMTIGVGFLSGRGGFFFGLGGFICYWFLAPMLTVFGSESVMEMAKGDSAPGDLRSTLFRPTGIGILIGSAVCGIIAAFPLIRSALVSLQKASASKDGQKVQGDEMPVKMLYIAIVAGACVLVAIALGTSSDVGIGRALAIAVLGTLWIWIAGVIVSECVGRTNWNPVSGMTLIAVTILLLVLGTDVPDVPRIMTAVVVGAAICVAISQAGDMMLDLKSGYLIGATPEKQQLAQFCGTWLGPFLVLPLIFVLDKAYTLGSDELPAPQGTALASMVEGIIGGNVPYYRYAAGAILGGILAFSPLGGIGVLIGLGFYMPFDIVLTYTIGCCIRLYADSKLGRKWVADKGIPIAAGFIIGEALVGVGYALFMIAKGMVEGGA